MPKIKVTAANVGQTIATGGTLKAVLFLKAPTEYRRPFHLVDDAHPGAPRSLFCEDVSTSWRIPGPHPLYSHELLSNDVAFGKLTVADLSRWRAI
jgi:hypothetical protein